MKKKSRWVLLTILCCIILLIAIFLVVEFSFRLYISRDLKDWKSGKYIETTYGRLIDTVIPSYETVSGYEEASFYWYKTSTFGLMSGMWLDSAICLQLTYDENSYPSAKDKFLTSYLYLEAPVFDEYGCLMPISETKIGRYVVRIVDDRTSVHDWENDTWYPKFYGLVAFNDDERTLRICYIVDHSLDSMPDEAYFISYIKRNFVIDWN